ncbi:hypothetical protein YQE_00751, partial [Dendroctonus ponderosae]
MLLLQLHTPLRLTAMLPQLPLPTLPPLHL